MKYQTKVILGGLVGNIVEAYDISICYFLSSELSRELLGDSRGRPTIIFSLIFIAYLAKPIGAFFLGVLSDLYGRKNVLIASILLMGLSTALIGTIPSHANIGILAAFFLLCLRITQSMALGSEFLNSSSLLVESGHSKQRGFRGCWSSVGVKAGYLLACIIVEGVHWYGKAHPEITNLWRIPFLIALITTGVGYYIRRKVPESLEYVRYYSNHKKPTTQSLYTNSLVFIKEFPFNAYFAFCTSFLSVTTGYFFYLYIPIHATQYSQHSRSFIMASTIFSLILVIVLIPIFGKLSDKYNRITFLTAASGGLALLSYPLMQAVNYGNEPYFLFMLMLISIPCACYYSVATVLLTDLFPLPIRCTSLALIYSIAASLASGLPPLVSDYLAKKTSWLNSPSLVIIIPSLLVILNIKFLLDKSLKIKTNYLITN